MIRASESSLSPFMERPRCKRASEVQVPLSVGEGDLGGEAYVVIFRKSPSCCLISENRSLVLKANNPGTFGILA